MFFYQFPTSPADNLASRISFNKIPLSKVHNSWLLFRVKKSRKSFAFTIWIFWYSTSERRCLSPVIIWVALPAITHSMIISSSGSLGTALSCLVIGTRLENWRISAIYSLSPRSDIWNFCWSFSDNSSKISWQVTEDTDPVFANDKQENVGLLLDSQAEINIFVSKTTT